MSDRDCQLNVVDLRCDHLLNPMGIACSNPYVSWKLHGETRGLKQTAYEIQAAIHQPDFEKGLVSEQGNQSDDSYAIELDIGELREKTTYYWRVRVCVDTEEEQGLWLPWSETASFETGLKDERSWSAKWIEADEEFYAIADEECKQYWKLDPYGDAENLNRRDQGLRKVPYLSKRVELKTGIIKARVYITARGLYELRVNGRKVGPCVLAPDFTAYDKCIYYQTFDIAAELQEGSNLFEIQLGDGWYAGHAQGIPGNNHLYGVRPSLLMQAEIQYEDGMTETIASDDSFKASMGPLQYADLFMGEYYDLQVKDDRIFGTVENDYSMSVVTPQRGEMIVATEVIDARRVFRDAEGSLIVDFGQVIAGRERLVLTGRAGSTVTIEHSEEIDREGVFYDVMPTFPFHDQKNTIRFAEEKTIAYEPQFSFQGFRYLRIRGLNYEIKPEDCKAVVIGTGMPVVGKFECSNPDLNQFMKNVLWSQRGNMLSIPTDCPQRERAGFTGDAQVFGKAAALNMDVSGFFARWLEQCRYEQLERGQIPIVVPYTKAYSEIEPNPGWTSAGWGDAIVFLPWEMYQAYGDIRFLSENYQAMLRWMDYVETCAKETMPESYYMDFKNRHRHKHLWNTGHHWGDWQVPGVDAFKGVELTKEVTASLFYYRQASMMMRISQELGESEKHEYFKELSANIHRSFHQEYVADGKLSGYEWQGAYVMAIAFGMVEGELKGRFAARLNELVAEQGFRLQTGFLSTPFLLNALWDCGYRDTALKLLYQDTAPSWLYQVKQGATTVWEEWEGKDRDGVLRGSSFNHYAFGCVCDFIYEKIGGIGKLEKGFKRIRIQPEATEGLEFAETTIDTIYGELGVKWNKVDGGYRYRIKIPPNTTAVVVGGSSQLELGSGVHEFELA
ncbi:family 78 glycoside hydrolase catalytic domain [Cohnella thailandensis]|uniref:alpha-L-rhamnosidase n=1 Tax=Cohnella thailandensis TaxID=557557 RepID=A0A841T2C3_9BACL|nr:family 78 glycoside hydrolase catalytic domain [Cohnella thailandensis]MBB6637189.1 family 78 glycoside hydrolase catalytic domain [Cohnella thailandensis]MBP1976989.1 alpha-L-rhamnosidase [Cohnella thailandensis]